MSATIFNGTWLEGLYLIEVMLLGCGVLLFLVTLFGILVRIFRNEELKPLVYLAAVSLVMMGFPAIQKIRFEKDAIELTKYARDSIEGDLDRDGERKMQELAIRVSKRTGAANPAALSGVSPTTLAALAEANRREGNLDLASRQIQAAARKRVTRIDAGKVRLQILKDIGKQRDGPPSASGGRPPGEVVAKLAETTIGPMATGEEVSVCWNACAVADF